MNASDGFLGIKFGQSLDTAHQRLSAEGFRFLGREASDAPIGRVLYVGTYFGNDATLHLDFIRNGFHRARLEIATKDAVTVEEFRKDVSRKFGPSERLTRNRQACIDDSPQDPCFDMWCLDDDTSIILDVTGSRDQPIIVIEFFRIL